MKTPEEREAVAAMLAGLAERIRKGELLVTNISMENELERFYDPVKEEWKYFRIGSTKLDLAYHNPEDQQSEVEARQKYLEAHPEAFPA